MALRSVGVLLIFLRFGCTDDSDCNYNKEVKPFQSYNVYNPNFPNKYKPGDQCSWIITTEDDYNLQLVCPSIDLPQSKSCALDRLQVSNTGELSSAKNYCGQRALNVTSNAQKLYVGLVSSKYGQGGKFICVVKAVPVASLHRLLENVTRLL